MEKQDRGFSYNYGELTIGIGKDAPLKHLPLSLILVLALLTACGPSVEQQATMTSIFQSATAASWTQTPSLTATLTPTLTSTATDTETPTDTLTPTETYTPTFTLTPSLTETLTPTETFTVTLSPTFDFPKVLVTMQAHCRFGPAKAYLHAADLYAGDKGLVQGRWGASNWLYVKMDKLNYWCWVSPSVVQVSGDITRVAYQPYLRLPPSSLYGSVTGVVARRQGDKVTVSWDALYMTEDDDRGYMLDVFVCQKGNYIWWPVGDGVLTNQNKTSYTFTDEKGCSEPSGGSIAAVEKHGYTAWVDIHWPPAK